jgi:hypothetical protein
MSIDVRAAASISLALLVGCGGSDAPNGAGGTAGMGGSRPDGGDCAGSGGGAGADDTDAGRPDSPFPPPPGDAGCQSASSEHPIEGALHVAVCSPVAYGTNPPSSGNHYPIWAAYKTYDLPIPRGFWVHSLEHGAMVITYNCPGGCATEVAEAQAFIDALPADCGSGTRRLILAPDPELDVRFAASAWLHTLRANCFDRSAFQTFYNEHYNRAPEAICGGGTDPTGMCGTPVCP